MQFQPFQTVEIAFDVHGAPMPLPGGDGDDARDALLAMANDVDDLIVISHGWNNDIPEAQALYTGVLESVGKAWAAAGLSPDAQRKTGVAALYWPSKKFDDADLIPGGDGGAASIDAPAAPDYAALIKAQLENLQGGAEAFGATGAATLSTAHAQVDNLDDEEAQNAYVAALAALLPVDTEEYDPGLDRGTSALRTSDGSAILKSLQQLLPPRAASPQSPSDAGGSGRSIDDTGGAPAVAGVHALGFDPIGDVKRAAWMLLNLTTYYTMKTLGGTVGRVGAAPLVAAALAAKPALRVHLVGHSFGGRLVTSLANALPDGSDVASMTLLQAAYSQYGLATAPTDGTRPAGAFRSVVDKGKVRGEIGITHSKYDWAVGAAYPIASEFVHSVADAVPTPDTSTSLYGGMGANGAQQTTEAFRDTLLDGDAPYAPLPAGTSIRNLEGSSFISSHGDVMGPQVAWAIVHGIAASHPA